MPVKDETKRKVTLIRKGELRSGQTLQIRVNTGVIEEFTVPPGKRLKVTMCFFGEIVDD